MTMQKAICGHNPAGTVINEGYYALLYSILKDVQPDEAILKITGRRPISAENEHREPLKQRKTKQNKIIELYTTTNNELSKKEIAAIVQCSVPSVEYAISNYKKKRTAATLKKESHKETIFEDIREHPFWTTTQIANKHNISYSTALKYIKEYYHAEQLALPYEETN